MKAKGEKCAFISKKGNRCNGYAVTDSDRCFAHTEWLKDQHKAAASKGGQNKPKQELQPLPRLELVSTEAISLILTDTINRSRRVLPDGSMDPKTANTISNLAGKLIELRKLKLLVDRVTPPEKDNLLPPELLDQLMADVLRDAATSAKQ